MLVIFWGPYYEDPTIKGTVLGPPRVCSGTLFLFAVQSRLSSARTEVVYGIWNDPPRYMRVAQRRSTQTQALQSEHNLGSGSGASRVFSLGFKVSGVRFSFKQSSNSGTSNNRNKSNHIS